MDIQYQLNFWFTALSLDERVQIYNRWMEDKVTSQMANSIVCNILKESNTPDCTATEFNNRTTSIDYNN